MGGVALLDSCTAKGPEIYNVLGVIRALKSSWQPPQVSYHVLSCHAGCHNDNGRQALAIPQGRPSAYSYGAAKASICFKGLRAQHIWAGP